MGHLDLLSPEEDDRNVNGNPRGDLSGFIYSNKNLSKNRFTVNVQYVNLRIVFTNFLLGINLLVPADLVSNLPIHSLTRKTKTEKGA